MRKSVCTMLLLLAAFAVPAFAGDDKKTPPQPPMDPAMQAMMTAMQPGEQHQQLKKLAGNFDYTIKMWMDPAAAPTESTGKRTAEMLLGGRYLEEKVSGNMMGMPFEGIGWMGYDNVAKQWVGTWMDNMGTGIMTMQGTADKGTWNMTGESSDPMTGKKVTMRTVTKLVDDNTYTMEMFGPGPDGKEVKMMEMTCKRTAM